MRSGAGDEGADHEHHHGPPDGDTADRDGPGVDERSGRARLGPVAVEQHDGIPQQDDRQQVVARDEEWVQIDQDGCSTENDLADHPGDQPPRPEDQVATARRASVRKQHGGADPEAHDPGEESVAEFDPRMEPDGRDEPVLTAGWPILTPRPEPVSARRHR
ncbi:MAG: hypothetical protein R2710_03850 [Acidimicrobiales bacterium]